MPYQSEDLHKQSGLQLQERRRRKGWTQQKLADWLGTTVATISRWERGISWPYPHAQSQLRELFGQDLFDELVPTRIRIGDPNLPVPPLLLGRARESFEAFDTLVDTGLPVFQAGHYQLYQTSAEYTRCQQAPSPESYAHFLSYAHHLVASSQDDYRMLELKSALVLAALDAASHASTVLASDDFQQVVFLVIPFLIGKGWNSLAFLYLQRARPFARSPLALARLLLREGQVCSETDYAHAKACFELVLASKVEEELLWETQLYLARLHANHGNISASTAVLQSAVETAERLGPATTAYLRTRFSAAWLQSAAGEQRRAIPLLRAVIAEAERCNRERPSAAFTAIIYKGKTTLARLIAHHEGNKEAETLLHEALALAQDLGSLDDELETTMNLSLLELHQRASLHDLSPIKERLQQALNMAKMAQHIRHQCTALTYLSYITHLQVQDEQAQAALAEAMELAREYEYLEYLALQRSSFFRWPFFETLLSQARREAHEGKQASKGNSACPIPLSAHHPPLAPWKSRGAMLAQGEVPCQST